MKIGFLPLYLQLYRNVAPDYDSKAAEFANVIAGQLVKLGANVVQAPVCARKDEVAAALERIKGEGSEVLVTLHLAYSPSLESEELIAAAGLPVIMLDTTPDYEYAADHSTLMSNHGIHGVQDLANLLRRRGVSYRVIAGHWSESNVMTKLFDAARAARCANAFRHSRVGRVGGNFEGMGDFRISDAAMKKYGIVSVDFCMEKHAVMPEAADIDREVAAMKSIALADSYDDETHRTTAISSLMVRNFIGKEKLDAFTCNFLDAHKHGVPTTPFMEACLAMSRGIGYAGEGDVLDAAWVSALMKEFPRTTFTEMFCPDWKCGRIYLSHMGEVNSALLEGAALSQLNGGFLPEKKPLTFTGSLVPGKVTLANIAPGPGDELELITVDGELLPFQESAHKRISGLFRPSMNLIDFLPAFSSFGGTHHSALCYDVPDQFWADLAHFLGMPLHRM